MLFSTPKIDSQEREVIARIEEVKTTLKYAVDRAPKRWPSLLRRTAFAKAIQGSNSIEGYNVTVEDAIAAAEGEEPLEASERDWLAVTGYRQAMTFVMQLADDPHFSYSADLLRGLHFMMVQHDLSKNPGKWRPGIIFVRDEARNEVVYEGPPAELVPGLIDELIAILNDLEGGKDPGMVRAAMGHLNLVMIHPFSDGNGRMARCLQTLILARTGVLGPTFSSIEEHLGRNTHDYYEVLAEVGAGSWNPRRNARPWVRFCLTAHYRQAMTLLRRSRELTRLWDALEQEIAKAGAPVRTLFAVADAAMGLRVRNATYRPIAEVSDQTASRDLKLLVEAGLLVPNGERRGRYYVAAPIVQKIRDTTREARGGVPDPFTIEPMLPGIGTELV